jgi:hypothetical protein
MSCTWPPDAMIRKGHWFGVGDFTSVTRRTGTVGFGASIVVAVVVEVTCTLDLGTRESGVAFLAAEPHDVRMSAAPVKTRTAVTFRVFGGDLRLLMPVASPVALRWWGQLHQTLAFNRVEESATRNGPNHLVL